MNRMIMSRLGVWSCLLLAPLAGWSFDLASDQNLTGSPSVLTGVGAGNAITNRAITGGNLYDWADVNGDGVRTDPVATAGLNLLGYRLTNSSGSHIVLNLAGGDIAGTGTVAMTTRSATGSSGRIEIRTTNDVDCGGILTTPASGTGRFTGDILIGSTSERAGNIRVNFLDTHQDTDSISAGMVVVYGRGHVRIANASGVAGDILTWTRRNGQDSITDLVGSVTVVHDGEFVARNIDTHHINDNTSRGGHVSLNGDGAANGASGACAVSNIYTYSSLVGTYGARGGNVTISGYSGVTVAGKIDTRSGNSGTDAGDVTITNISGTINLPGTFDLRHLSNPSRAGDLVLSAAGKIQFVNLDLAMMKSATAASPAGVYVTGAISGFPTATPADGTLDAPAGTTIHYQAKLPGNEYLAGDSYILKSGGKLRSESKGTVVVFR